MKQITEIIYNGIPCTCDVAYKSRGLAAPDCPQCNYADDLVMELQEQLQPEWISVSDEFPPFDTPVMLRGVISWKSKNSVSYFSDEVQTDCEILEYGQSGYTLKFNNDYLVCSHPNPDEIMDEYITHWKPLVEPPAPCQKS